LFTPGGEDIFFWIFTAGGEGSRLIIANFYMGGGGRGVDTEKKGWGPGQLV